MFHLVESIIYLTVAESNRDDEDDDEVTDVFASKPARRFAAALYPNTGLI